MAKITNKDIAARAGVSPAAVSMAIHGRKGISEATRAHILSIVQELNYKPPQQMHTAQIRTIVLLLPEDDAPMLPSLLQVLTQLAREGLYALRIHSVAQTLTDPAQILQGCDLLITFDDLDRASLDQLSELVRQILVLDGNFVRKPYWNIRIDYAGAAYMLTRYMAELGHRNFIYLNDDLPSSKNLLCFSGFQRLLVEQHLPLDPGQIILELSRDTNIWTHVPDIIRNANCSAILCTSAHAAIETVRHLKEFGYRVPQDISVAVITTTPSDALSAFSFTHICLNCRAVGQELRRLSSRFISPDEIVDVLIPYSQVVPGATVAPPRYNPAKKKLAIALHLKNHPSLRIVRAGFLNKIQQLGYQAEVVGIESGDPAEFEQTLRTLLNMDIDGIVSWLVVPDVFKAFSRKGIPVVALHGLTPGSESCGEQTRVSADPTLIAQSVANYYAQHLANRSGILAVSQSDDNPLESSITRELIRIMAEKCPQITIRHVLNFLDDDSHSTKLVLDYIRRTPDLVAAFSTAGFACVTWAAAKKAAGRDDIMIIGTDYCDESIHLIETGEICGFIAQPLYEEGQMAVVALDTILRGHRFPSSCLLDAPLVTQENLEKYRRLLQDAKNWYI